MKIEKAKGYIVDGKHFETISEAKQYKFDRNVERIIGIEITKCHGDSDENRDILANFMTKHFETIFVQVNNAKKEIFARTKKENVTVEDILEEMPKAIRMKTGVTY